jgi:hypothetical protein
LSQCQFIGVIAALKFFTGFLQPYCQFIGVIPTQTFWQLR